MKTAIIFGGSNGIGAQIAKEFARGGYFVVVNYNSSKEAALALVDNIKDEGGEAIAIKADRNEYFHIKFVTFT